MQLYQRRILLGISGGIAAYKTAELARRLVEQGAEVRVVMTVAATHFITPLTMQSLVGNEVHLDLFDPASEAAMGHIELSRWADIIVVAPASADIIAKLAGGHANDLLSTLCLASEVPLVLVPAMNQAMWSAATTQSNVATLEERGVKLLGPAEGNQACGETGLGRMLEPPDIIATLVSTFFSGAWAGVRILINAGPTREPIDEVRYISNRSSGRMGYALAAACVNSGAEVLLISGPVNVAPPRGVQMVYIETAASMHAEVLKHAPSYDVFLAVAAVADYRLKAPVTGKIPSGESALELKLLPNPDIITEVLSQPNPPFTVAFAAQWGDPLPGAVKKLTRKKAHLLIANDVSTSDGGFDSEYNKAMLIAPEGQQKNYELMPKSQLAQQLMADIIHYYRNYQPST